MRGDFGDKFDPLGTDRTEPSGIVVSLWAGVACLALILALVAWQYGSPDRNGAAEMSSTGSVYADPGGRSDIAAMGGGPATEHLADIAAELARQRIENAALRQTQDVMRGQIDGLSDRLSALEAKLTDMTGTISAAEPPPPAVVDMVSPPAGETATLATRAPAAARTQFGVELGTFADLGSIRDAWRRIRRENPELFGSLSALATVRDRSGQTELLLVAGPFTNASDAASLCGRLAGTEQSCMPAFYVGQPL